MSSSFGYHLHVVSPVPGNGGPSAHRITHIGYSGYTHRHWSNGQFYGCMVVVQTVEGSWDTCNLGRNLLSGSVNLYLTVSPGVSIPSICVTLSDNERYWVLMIVFSSAAFRYSAGFSFESKFGFNFPECTGELSWLPSQQNYELPTLLDTGEHTGSGPLQCMANPPMQRAFPPRVGEDGWTQRLIHLGSGCLSARGIVEINVYYV